MLYGVSWTCVQVDHSRALQPYRAYDMDPTAMCIAALEAVYGKCHLEKAYVRTSQRDLKRCACNQVAVAHLLLK